MEKPKSSMLAEWAASALIVVTLALALASTLLSAQPATARPLITGVSGIDDFSPSSMDLLASAGGEFAQLWIQVSEVAPAKKPQEWQPKDPADPHYNWQSVDERIVRVVEAGLTPLVGIYGAPRWAQRCHVESAAYWVPCDPDIDLLSEIAHAAASRFSGRFAGLPRVRFWQVFNEPNLSLYLNPQFHPSGKLASPDFYRRLINASYPAIKSVHPSNRVLAAGLGPIARPGSTVGPMRFTREFLCMTGRRKPRPIPKSKCGGGVRFDIFDIHPYTTGGPTHKGKVDDVQLGDLTKLAELIRAADRAGRIKGTLRRTPIWVTEFSWDSRPPDPGGVRMRILKRWTAEALFRAWRAGVSRFFWFGLRDFERKPGVPSHETLESGLYFRGKTIEQDRPKPHMYAFRFPFVAYSKKDGFYFWGRTPTSTPGRVLLQVRTGRGWQGAGATRADRHGIFEGKVEGLYGRRKRGWVRAVYRRERSVPFSLKPVRDFYQPPFGKPVPE